MTGKGLLDVVCLDRGDIETRIRTIETQMEELRAFLFSSYSSANCNGSDPVVLSVSERFDALLNEWMSLKSQLKK